MLVARSWALSLLCFAGCTAGAGSLDAPPEARAGACGDGVLQDGELCDGDQLDGETCATYGYPGGSLRCNSTCTGHLLGGCTGIPAWNTHPEPCDACGEGQVCITTHDLYRGPRIGCVRACRTPALGEGGALELDVRTVRVRGEVTLGGARFPEVGNRGRVLILGAMGDGVAVPIGSLPRASFEATVYAGRQRLFWLNRDRPDHPEAPVWLAEVEADRDLELNVDIPRPTTVSGVFDVRGPLVPERVTLRFSSLEHPDQPTRYVHDWPTTVTLRGPFPRSFQVVLPPGSHGVTAAVATGSSFFSGQLRLADLTPSEARAFARVLESGTLRVRASRGGAPQAGETITASAEVYPWSARTGDDGWATLALPRGRYEVRWGELTQTVELEEQSSVDFELPPTLEQPPVPSGPPVRVTGRITMNGGPLRPLLTEGEERWIRFVGGLLPVVAPVDGDGRYVAELPVGEHRVELQIVHTPRFESSDKTVALLRPSWTVSRAGTRDFDLKLVTYEGEVVSRGGELPPSPWPDRPGRIALSSGRRTHGAWPGRLNSPGEVAFEPSGPARFSFVALPGRYRRSIAPPGHEPLHLGLSMTLDEDKYERIDLGLAPVSGRVTLNGPWPAGTPGLGALVFTSPEASVSVPLRPESDGRFSVHLLPADYRVVLIPAHRDLPEGPVLLRPGCR